MTQTAQQMKHPVLQRPLLAGAIFADLVLCALLGITLMLRPGLGPVAIGLSAQTAVEVAPWFIALGLVLQGVSAIAFITVALLPMPAPWVWSLIIMNLLWGVGSYALWLTGVIPAAGVITVMVLANIVLVIAVLQIIGVVFSR